MKTQGHVTADLVQAGWRRPWPLGLLRRRLGEGLDLRPEGEDRPWNLRPLHGQHLLSVGLAQGRPPWWRRPPHL